MAVKGVIRNLDQLGRVVIPKEMRSVIGLEPGDPMEIVLDHNTVVIRKYSNHCVCCGAETRLKELNGVHFCASCLKKLAEL